MSRTGDDALGMRRTTLDSLIQTCGFPERLKRIYLLRQPHQSRHVHFAKDKTTPVAISNASIAATFRLLLTMHSTHPQSWP